MVTTTLVLSGIDMSEDEYLETLSPAARNAGRRARRT
jgi:hypothetical protein